MLNDSATQRPILEFDRVSFSFKKKEVIHEASLKVYPGESAVIVGPSGAGKSTLFALAAGLQKASSGEVRVNGASLDAGPLRSNRSVRAQHIGIVFQAGHLLPELSAPENVALPALVNGVPYKEAIQRAQGLLETLGLSETSSRPSAQYSGGEQQRIAVARSLICDPAIILADEPTGSLDPQNRDLVAELLFSIPAKLGKTVLIVTHDPIVADQADRHFVLADKTLTESVRVHA